MTDGALSGSGIRATFPLWRRPTSTVADCLIDGGLKAFVTCVDIARAPPELAGRWYDRSLIADLPPGVDPCGENGEFHTVVAGPHFSQLIDVAGEVVGGDGFVFAT